MEDHDDFKKLDKIYQERFDERDREKTKEGYQKENELEVNDGIKTPMTDFYCKRCKKDYDDYRTTYIIQNDWERIGKKSSFWKSKHKCGQWNIRYVTDKSHDPYWTLSPKMKKDRGNYYRDMVQPDQSGFDMLFGHKFNQKEV